MKVSTVVSAVEHSEILKIAGERGATVGAVALLAIQRFIREARHNPKLIRRLPIDGRRKGNHAPTN
ncbi:MAG: hypothetical protein ACREMY_03145 [bacterium]